MSTVASSPDDSRPSLAALLKAQVVLCLTPWPVTLGLHWQPNIRSIWSSFSSALYAGELLDAGHCKP